MKMKHEYIAEFEEIVKRLEPLFKDIDEIDKNDVREFPRRIKSILAAEDRVGRFRDVRRNGGFDGGVGISRGLIKQARVELIRAINLTAEIDPIDDFGRNTFPAPQDILDELTEMAEIAENIYNAN